MKRSSWALPIIAFAVFLTLAGCQSKPPRPAATAKHYPIQAIVVSTNPAQTEVTLDAQAIPGFMDAMTMPYKVQNAYILQELHPGDHLTGTIAVANGEATLDEIVITQQAKPDYKPAAQYHLPALGDLVPDFRFLNQNGQRISIDQFRGKALLLTFIYTRCPLGDYCPRMSRNFAAIDQQLKADPALYAKTHLLSLSFDPAYDTPAVLRSYGGAYTGNFTTETFRHWDFAAPPKDELPKVLQYFDVGATPEKDKTITHSLSTALIGPDGKIVEWFPGNDWQPSTVVHDLKKVLDQTTQPQPARPKGAHA